MTNAFGISSNPLAFFRLGDAAILAPFKRGLRDIALAAGVQTGRLNECVDAWMAAFRNATTETELIETLRLAMGSRTALSDAFDVRADRIVGQVLPLLTFSDVLDWGCGDGAVAQRLSDRGYTVQCLDVVDFRRAGCGLPFTRYDESVPATGLPKCDTVLVLTVLHHASNPGRTLRDLLSTLPRQVIVIESVPELDAPEWRSLEAQFRGILQYEYCGLVDWVYNRVIHSDIHVPFNYMRRSGWRQFFEVAGYDCDHDTELGLDQPLAPEWHVLQRYVRTG
jgi:2-polyprenyl-3-methyl-5-hydroxy-6-metoxy-1,4-benzoquinol methylase